MSGAVVPNARVSAVGPAGQTRSANTSQNGAYEIGGLAPGKYTVTATANGFAPFSQREVVVTAGLVEQLNIPLDIQVQQEEVDVEDDSSQVQVSPSNNASAIVLKGADLDALPDDPDELEQDLQALAGPSAGPNGGQIYIDGFTGGQLRRSLRFVRSELIKTRFLPNSTNWATEESRSSPSQVPTSITDSSQCRATARG